MTSPMTAEERRAFFDKEGYWPIEAHMVSPPRPVSAKRQAEMAANRLQLATRTHLLRGWRTPLHWTVPMAFDQPGRMYEELGHEEFLRQVSEYYSAIRESHVNKAYLVHLQWAIKQILRAFETHVKGFRGQAVSSKGGRIRGFGSGQQKWGPKEDFKYRASKVLYEDIEFSPQELAQDSRLVADLGDYVRAYGVRESDREAVVDIVKGKLGAIWGVKL